MKYQCTNPECNFTFTHPSKYIESPYSELKTTMYQTETYVCPNCHKINFTESVESASEVESVYIYELTTGPQTELNGLLAQGYCIVNRYAKAYHLEKPKAAESPQQSEDKFTEDAKLFYAKLHGDASTAEANLT